MNLTKLFIIVGLLLDEVYGNYTLQRVQEYKIISMKNFTYLVEGILEGTIGQ